MAVDTLTTKLEAQLEQSDEQLRSHVARLDSVEKENAKLRAQVADLRPLAEAAAEHRETARKEKLAKEQAERAAQQLTYRVEGLEQELLKAEQTIAGLEAKLQEYEALDKRAAKAEKLSDLLR